MRIYDISQEVFSCQVYPGDPSPERHMMLQISDGAVCNLTAFGMCAHNGTHVDAPYHFIDSGKKVDEVSMERFVGFAYVTEFEGDIAGDDARKMVEKANKAFAEEDAPCIKVETPDKCRRILVKGKAVVTEEAAKVFVESNLLLFGNESQTVGPEDAPMAVHLIMLAAEIVLLEGIRLADVEEGIYLLDAAPINLGGADGAPCRAILMQL